MREIDEQLWRACRDGCIDTAKRYIAQGADIHTQDKWRGYTPLHMAVMHGHMDIAKILLDAGAVVYAQDYYGYTPLHIAASDEGHNKTMVLLKQYMAKGRKDESI